jgi:hypothetical protein
MHRKLFMMRCRKETLPKILDFRQRNASPILLCQEVSRCQLHPANVRFRQSLHTRHVLLLPGKSDAMMPYETIFDRMR